MNTKIKSVLAAASMLALSALTANAQLIFNTGSFKGVWMSVNGSPTGLGAGDIQSTTTVNALSGVDGVSAPTYSQVKFTGGSLTAPLVVPNFPNFSDTVNIGVPLHAIDFEIFNGLDNGVSAVSFDLYFDFTSTLGAGIAKIATVSWTWLPTGAAHPIDGGPNSGKLPPNSSDGGQWFFSTYSSDSFYIGDVKVFADISGTTEFTVANGRPRTNQDTAAFSVAVPEPSTYALFGVVGLMGLVAIRRIRSSKKAA